MSHDPTSSSPTLQTAKNSQREQEGWARALSIDEDQMPACSSAFYAHGFLLSDFRGEVGAPGQIHPPHRDRDFVEWETSPAQSDDATTFVWIGGSQLRPALHPAYPQAGARLLINGEPCLEFPLGRASDWTYNRDDVALSFQARRVQTLVEVPHRVMMPDGASGFYRLQVPSRLLEKNQPLRLRVELLPIENAATFFFVSPRNDALQIDLEILRGEVERLQQDVTQLRLSHEQLFAQIYPELFPTRIKGKRSIALQEAVGHLHPPMLTVLRDGEILISVREATDHIATNGHIVVVSSRDGGQSWSEKRVLFDLGNCDHRASPIFELANGDWITTDYRAGNLYGRDGTWQAGDTDHPPTGPSLWGAWSSDRGASWSFSDEPLTVPGARLAYAEAERHMIQLPDGRLLVAANFNENTSDGKVDWDVCGLAIFCSEDDGRAWQVLACLPHHPYIIGEPTLLQTQSGKIVLLSRTQWGNEGGLEKGGLLQIESQDDGKTWGEWRQTGMSSMGSPAHLLQLQDGRVLCTHAARQHPGSIYVTTSNDQGATWSTQSTRTVANDIVNWDACYPTSGQLPNGDIITVWYANLFGKFFLPTLRYRPEEL